jgi:hypothetical protein
MSRLVIVSLLFVIATESSAQAAVTPTGWTWRTDAPAMPRAGQQAANDSTFRFEPMAPGYHITMGPGGLLYDSREQADHRFVVEAQLIYFSDGANAAEYGVFVGGSGLDGDQAAWVAFVVRPDGQAAVVQHARGATSMLLDWTRLAGVAARDSTGFARNTVSVRAEPDSVRFVVNGMVLKTFARSTVPSNGHYGFRVGRGANLHITNLDITRRLAPFPVRR